MNNPLIDSHNPQTARVSSATSASNSSIKVDLISAQHAHAIIDVRIDGSTQIFQSTIVEVNLNRKWIVIDEMFPAGFNGARGQRLTVTLRLAGRRVDFTTQLLERTGLNGASRYHLELPAGFSYSQRRETWRFRVTTPSVGFSEFTTPQHYYCAGQIQDISLCGMRVQLQQRIAVSAGDILPELQFEFLGSKFCCQGLVRNLFYDVAGNAIIGIEFRQMTRPQERELERILVRLQREEARAVAAARLQSAHSPAVKTDAIKTAAIKKSFLKTPLFKTTAPTVDWRGNADSWTNPASVDRDNTKTGIGHPSARRSSVGQRRGVLQDNPSYARHVPAPEPVRA